jgi:hypothetical protein
MSDDRDRVRDLDAWLAPFLAVMGRKTRRTRSLGRPRRFWLGSRGDA